MNTAEHLEHHLGAMERGWSSRSCPGVQVCLFRDRPSPGVFVLATLGLSNVVLPMSGDRPVRQELLIGARDAVVVEDLSRILFHVADHLKTGGRALLRGEVLRIDDLQTVSPGCDSLYASIPVVFPDGFETLDSDPATVFPWLIPLQAAETRFVEASGWSAFEDRLEAAQPDLFDLSRGSVV